MDKIISLSVIVVVVALGAYFYLSSTNSLELQTENSLNTSNSQPSVPIDYTVPQVQVPAPLPVPVGLPGANSPAQTSAQTPAVSQTARQYEVEIKDNSFVPASLTIKKGDTIVWVNKMSKPSWPASALHPTHAVYPVPGGCISSLFDACRGLKQGETFVFTFNISGAWKYHDHLNALEVKPGIIIVSE